MNKDIKVVMKNYLLSQTLNSDPLVLVFHLDFYEVNVSLLVLIMVGEVY